MIRMLIMAIRMLDDNYDGYDDYDYDEGDDINDDDDGVVLEKDDYEVVNIRYMLTLIR